MERERLGSRFCIMLLIFPCHTENSGHDHRIFTGTCIAQESGKTI